jgi:hypothetical protein
MVPRPVALVSGSASLSRQLASMTGRLKAVMRTELHSDAQEWRIRSPELQRL